MNTFVIHQELGGEALSHGGPRKYRNFTMFVNGKEWETYFDDQAPDYRSGKYLDKMMQEEAEKLKEFFGGVIYHSKDKRL